MGHDGEEGLRAGLCVKDESVHVIVCFVKSL